MIKPGPDKFFFNSHAHFNKFLKFLTGFSISYLVIVFSINYCADPYGLRRYGGRVEYDRLFKAIQVNRMDPELILLGSSNVAVGLNPEHVALKNYNSVYNLGLMGANIYEKKRYFQHAASSGKLKKAIIGLEFSAFNQLRQVKPGFSESRLSSRQLQPKDFLRVYFSIRSLMLTAGKLTGGEDDWREYFDKKGALPHPKNFNIKDRKKLFATHLIQNFSSGGRVYGEYQLSPESLNHFEDLVETAQHEGVDTHIFIPPVHVTLFYSVSISEYWTTYQQWFRQVVLAHPVWDFSGCNSVTTKPFDFEPVNSNEQYYHDPLHYTLRVGNFVINRMSALETGSVPEDFGVYVTSENVSEHLKQVKQQCEQWQRENPEIVRWLESLNLKGRLVPLAEGTEADNRLLSSQKLKWD